MAGLKPYEQKWMGILNSGKLDNIKIIRNTSDPYSNNSYQTIIEIKNGVITVIKKVTGKFFNGKENEKFIEETVHVLDKKRDIVNIFKKYNYVDDLKKPLDFSEYAAEKALKAEVKAAKTAQFVKENVKSIPENSKVWSQAVSDLKDVPKRKTGPKGLKTSLLFAGFGALALVYKKLNK